MNLEGHVTVIDGSDIIATLSKLARLCLEASWDNGLPEKAQSDLSDAARKIRDKVDELINKQFHATSEQFTVAASELQVKVNDIKSRIARLNQIAEALEMAAQISTIVDDVVAIAAGLAN